MFQSISNIYKIYSQSTGITTDTRKIQAGNLFFALKGDNFNGNKFAAKALESGASYAVVDEKEYAINDQYLLVEDVLQNLQGLANHHRKQFNIPIIGITGTNGKTTTKELLATVLQTKYKTHYTQGNLNNHIGVPLTLLEMTKDTEIAIVEMGANHIGDIDELCQIAEPTHGIITNIGKAHLEGFGSLEGVARTKSELFKFILENKGTVFINGENEILSRMGKRFTNPLTYSFSNKNDYCYGELIEVNPFIKLNYNNETNRQTNLIGKYNFENILAALAIAKFFEVDDKRAIDAICNYTPSNNRSQVLEKGSNKILLDAYNANPTSMLAAIENFEAIKHDYKIVILGDMFELGDISEAEHLSLFETVTNKGFNTTYFVGKHFHKILNNDATVFETKEEMILELQKEKISNALILIKGSRGIGLETIIDEL